MFHRASKRVYLRKVDLVLGSNLDAGNIDAKDVLLAPIQYVLVVIIIVSTRRTPTQKWSWDPGIRIRAMGLPCHYLHVPASQVRCGGGRALFGHMVKADCTKS